MPSAPSSSTATREFGRQGVPFGFHGEDDGTNGRLVTPLIRVKTLQALEKPVPLLGRARPPRDAVVELRITRPEPGGPLGSYDASKRRLVLDDRRRGGL